VWIGGEAAAASMAALTSGSWSPNAGDVGLHALGRCRLAPFGTILYSASRLPRSYPGLHRRLLHHGSGEACSATHRGDCNEALSRSSIVQPHVDAKFLNHGNQHGVLVFERALDHLDLLPSPDIHLQIMLHALTRRGLSSFGQP